MTFETIVKNYARPANLLDEQPVKAQLVADLERNRQMNSRLYAIYLTLVVVVAVAAIGALLAGMWSGKTAALVVAGGAGVTVPIMLGLTKSAVREWSRSDLLITVAKASSEQQLQKILDTLLSSEELAFGGKGKVASEGGHD